MFTTLRMIALAFASMFKGWCSNFGPVDRRPCFSIAVAVLLVVSLSGISLEAQAQSQTGTISGTVTDAETGDPLPGVNIVVSDLADQGVGAATKVNGEFLIEGVPAGEHTLRARFVGYQAKKKTVTVQEGEETVIDFALQKSLLEMDEVTVTGTAGGTRQRALGNSVGRIEAGRIADIAPVGDAGELLKARTPGVQVDMGSGMAAGGPKINIRGMSSLFLNSEPLLYVDGIRVNNKSGTGADDGNVISRLNDFAPEDIKSIEVIRGPSAATLYGTEAANGVIQIITKKGKEGAPEITFETSQAATWLARAEERWNEMYFRDESGEVQTVNLWKRRKEQGNPITHTGHHQQYSLGVQGGTEGIQYYSAVNYSNEDGYTLHNSEEKVSGRVNLTVPVTSTFNVTSNAMFVTTDVNTTDDSYFTNSNPGNPDNLDDPVKKGSTFRRHDLVARNFLEGQEVERFTGSLQMQHQVGEWFSQNLSAGIDWTNEANLRLHKQTDDPELRETFGSFYTDGYRYIWEFETNKITADYNASANFDLTESLSSKTSFGAQYYRTAEDMNFLEGRGFPSPSITSLNAAASTVSEQTFFENVTMGLYLQERLSLNDRLFVTGAIRADDNSAFGEEFSLATYPKLSASWVIGEEPFFNVPFVSQLKLRTAYGESGLQPKTFASLRSFTARPGFKDRPGLIPQAAGNPELEPERAREIEVGFDAGLFNDRVGIDLSFYDQTVRDALINTTVAPSTGFSDLGNGQWTNLGAVQNRGFELLLDGRPVQSEVFTARMSVSLSYNDSEVTDVGDREFIPVGWGNFRHQVGYEPRAVFTKEVVSAELDDDGNPVNVMCAGGPDSGPMPCDEAPKVYQGPTQAPWSGAFNFTATFLENFQFYTSFDFRDGGPHLWNQTYVQSCVWFPSCELNVRPKKFDPKRVAAAQLHNRFQMAEFYGEASYLKWREASLSYRVPEKWLTSFGGERANINLALRNIAIWSPYRKTLDPENQQLDQENPSQSVWASGDFPLPTQFEVNVRLTF